MPYPEIDSVLETIIDLSECYFTVYESDWYEESLMPIAREKFVEYCVDKYSLSELQKLFSEKMNE